MQNPEAARCLTRTRTARSVLIALAIAAPVSAFDANQFAPGVDPYPYFSVVSSRTAPAGRFHLSLWYTYAEPTLNISTGTAELEATPGLLGPLLDPLLRPVTEPLGQGLMPARPITDLVLCALRPVHEPLVSPALDPLFDCPAMDVASLTVVERIHYGDLVGTYAITDWLEVGIDVPFSYIESDASGADEGMDIDDIRLVGKLQLLDALAGGVGIAVSPFVDFGVGDEAHLTSNGTTDYGLLAAVEAVAGRFRTSFNAGYRVNNKAFSDDDETDEILFGLGLGYLLLGEAPVFSPASTRLELLGEIFGASAEQRAFEDEFATPVEFLAGGRFVHRSGLLFAAGAGRKITDSINGPDFRVVAQGGYTWQPEPPPPAPEPTPLPTPEPPPPPQAQVVVTDEQIITLEPIYFDFDKSTIKPLSYPILDQVAQVMADRPEIEVRIEGHTDWIGTDAYNQGLSERRAESVKSEMVRLGMNPDEITTVGKNFSEPLVPTGPGVREPQ
ncbi:MAG: OmpA family protein, partial [Candidatus Binatia bacterium]